MSAMHNIEYIPKNNIVKPDIEISDNLRYPSCAEVDGIVLREVGTALLI